MVSGLLSLPSNLERSLWAGFLVAAERHRANIEGGELGALIWGEGSVFQRDSLSLYSGVPGPLGGGVEAVVPIPSKLESSIRNRLEADELTAESFFGLVNAVVIFRADTQLSELAARALARVGYQFRKSSGGDEAFALLNGLAMVGAVTRSTALAKGVQILARIGRRHARDSFSPDAVARVALIAAAANEGFSGWREAVGDWVTELAFAEMSREEAVALQQVLGVLLEIEPRLWSACGRAVAALQAVVRSLPDETGRDTAHGRGRLSCRATLRGVGRGSGSEPRVGANLPRRLAAVSPPSVVHLEPRGTVVELQRSDDFRSSRRAGSMTNVGGFRSFFRLVVSRSLTVALLAG